jgi:hypothetical protein
MPPHSTEEVPSRQPSPVDSSTGSDELSGSTVGTEPIDKKQPWRDIVNPDKFAQPDFFVAKPKPDTPSKIRLLLELDNKSR